MPKVAGRRHPLFLRLLKPLPPIYPDAVTETVPNSSYGRKKVGVVHLVTQSCGQLKSWARDLRALHALDRTHETDVEISPLSLKPLLAKNLPLVGREELERIGEQGLMVKTVRATMWACRTVTMIAVLLDRPGGAAVGFVSFALDWRVGPDGEDAELEIEPDQVWIAPEFRQRGWGCSLAYTVASAARMQLDQLDASTKWGGTESTPLEVLLGAEIYSTSGERFLRQCYEHLEIELEMRINATHLDVVNLEYQARL